MTLHAFLLCSHGHWLNHRTLHSLAKMCTGIISYSHWLMWLFWDIILWSWNWLYCQLLWPWRGTRMSYIARCSCSTVKINALIGTWNFISSTCAVFQKNLSGQNPTRRTTMVWCHAVMLMLTDRGVFIVLHSDSSFKFQCFSLVVCIRPACTITETVHKNTTG